MIKLKLLNHNYWLWLETHDQAISVVNKTQPLHYPAQPALSQAFLEAL